MGRVITPEFRASYANVWEPAQTPSGDMKYSISMIFPKGTDLTEIKKAIRQCIVEKHGEDEKKWPKGLKNPLRDGDTDRDGKEYENALFLNAGSKNQPGIVDSSAKPITDRSEFYSGCYARASVSFFYFDKAGNRGVGCGLNNLMKVKDGERLDGRRAAEDEFAEYASPSEGGTAPATDTGF